MKRVEPTTIGELLDSLFKSPNIAAKIVEGSLPETWRRVVGPAMAAETRQVRFVRGTLYVHVASSVVRSELMRRREALTAALNREAGMAIIKSVVVQ